MTFYLLGTGAAVSDPHRTTTMLAVEEAGRFVLVDCGGDAFQRVLAAGLDPANLDAVILTHEHPDHVSGYPLLIEKLWLFGRREPIPVYGPAPTLHLARTLFGAFSTDRWDGLPDREYNDVVLEPDVEVLRTDDLSITATPVDHPVPTIGLRFESSDGSVLAYSCDTAKSHAVVDLARNADVLIHEANGSIPHVHSSPEEAAETAAEAGAERLILVHLPPAVTEDKLVDARRIFGRTELGVELGSYEVARKREVA
ncbi:MAG: MBL fold metallo-hydrolase [Bacteroidetes bacterium]|nr:MBL fold metallo-hydrolase [Bacteroidota bacterium]